MQTNWNFLGGLVTAFVVVAVFIALGWLASYLDRVEQKAQHDEYEGEGPLVVRFFRVAGGKASLVQQLEVVEVDLGQVLHVSQSPNNRYLHVYMEEQRDGREVDTTPPAGDGVA